MTAQQHTHFSRYARLPGQPPGLFAKLLAFLLSAAVVVIGLLFSLAALAVVAVAGLGLGGWLWWKSRALRRAMPESPEPSMRPAAGEVIEGVAVRCSEEAQGNEIRASAQ